MRFATPHRNFCAGWHNGKTADEDFNYDPIMFGPHSFVHHANSTIPNATTTNATDLLAHFHNDLNVRWGGIRKPRTYSNIPLSNSSGWLLPNNFDVGAGDNNWNMSATGGMGMVCVHCVACAC